LERSDPFVVPIKGADISIRLGKGTFAAPFAGRTLAFLPIWPGFAIDATLYTAVWAIAILGVGHLVRRRRVRTGHCKCCRYDLTGITTGVCPECGTPIKTEAAE
jgi:hypothetical protein